jgi:hypothetical protein
VFRSLILQSDVHVNTIANALSKMPKVRRVICKSNNWRIASEAEDIFFIPEFNQNAIGDPRISQLYPKAGQNRSLIGNHMDNRYKDKLGHFRYLSTFNYGLNIMCHAISIANVQLQTLSIGCPLGNSFDELYNVYPATFVLMSPREITHTCNAFQYLRQISLTFKCFDPREMRSHWIRGNGVEKNVARTLAAAKNLEDLRLDFSEMTFKHGDFTLKEYLGPCAWPRLRSLCLRNKNVVNHEELTDLIYRHHQTLKSLNLDSIRLADANWWTWARQVRPWVSSSPFEKINLYELQDAEGPKIFGHCLESYLLQENDDLEVCSWCYNYWDDHH